MHPAAGPLGLYRVFVHIKIYILYQCGGFDLLRNILWTPFPPYEDAPLPVYRLKSTKNIRLASKALKRLHHVPISPFRPLPYVRFVCCVVNDSVGLGAGRDGGHGAVQLPRGGGDCEGEGVTKSIAPT